MSVFLRGPQRTSYPLMQYSMPHQVATKKKMIKLIISASTKVCGQKFRDGYSSASLQSQKLVIPNYKKICFSLKLIDANKRCIVCKLCKTLTELRFYCSASGHKKITIKNGYSILPQAGLDPLFVFNAFARYVIIAVKSCKRLQAFFLFLFAPFLRLHKTGALV